MLNAAIERIFWSLLALLISSSLLQAEEQHQNKQNYDAQQTSHLSVPLPVSELLDDATKEAHKRATNPALLLDCPNFQYPFKEDKAILIFRRCEKPVFAALIKTIRQRYKVDIQDKTLGGVKTEIVVPANGIANKNKGRVLINLHGGGFVTGGGPKGEGQIESIAVAAIGKIKVVSVDYRMYPEHVFPAATDDVIAVYKELLKSYQPENIGIYGCSAGAILTAQTVARLQYEGLPKPGAIGMLCSAAIWPFDYEGDSSEMLMRINGKTENVKQVSYFKHESPDNALISPANYPETLKLFPPSLLVSST